MQDLGTLGEKQGVPVTFAWTRPSMFPDVLPWLVLLGLLALPRNRDPNAWWIWVPVACAFGLQALLRTARTMLPGQPTETFAGAVLALSFGVASLWLLAGAVERKSRFTTFLLTLTVVTGFGSAAYLIAALSSQSTPQSIELFFEGILVLMCGVIIPAALTLGGVLCRRCYRPSALLVWSLIWAIAVALLLVTPLRAYVLMASPGQILWSEFFVGTSLLSALSFAILLPFLVLAFANGLFRERLKSLLLISGTEKPRMLVPFGPKELLELRQHEAIAPPSPGTH